MAFRKGQSVWVQIPGRKHAKVDEVLGPAKGALGQDVPGMFRCERAGNVPESALSHCWWGWSGHPHLRFGMDPFEIEVGCRVETLLGVRAKVLSIDDDGYARLEGLQGVRYVAHLRWVADE